MVRQIVHQGFLKLPVSSRPAESVQLRPEAPLLSQYLPVDADHPFSEVPPRELQHVRFVTFLQGVFTGKHQPQEVASLFEVLDLAFDFPKESLEHALELDTTVALANDAFDALQRETKGAQLLYPVQPQKVFGRIEAVARCGTLQPADQPQLLVVPDGFRGNAEQIGDLPDQKPLPRASSIHTRKECNA